MHFYNSFWNKSTVDAVFLHQRLPFLSFLHIFSNNSGDGCIFIQWFEKQHKNTWIFMYFYNSFLKESTVDAVFLHQRLPFLYFLHIF